ncbi:MAG TPA: GH32 C-terminal domain-containing protein, partial [Chitinophagaceae bacterium]|nr:GH32 C-terminal domain-containing protein [Chitinophagaceae bacterium]
WNEKDQNWIMALATLDRISFYSSPDLKTWMKESEFGETVGAHGGVWECPDLFPVTYNGQTVWVLFVSINPGGPNKGSATQYFIGQFDGKTFTPYQTDTRWLDYGPDNYAGVTWSNVGDRKLFLGWMGNWQYANLVPTYPWRSAMTIARDIGINKIGEKFMLTSTPAKELNILNESKTALQNIDATNYDITEVTGKMAGPTRLKFNSDKIENFKITLSNDFGEKLIVGFDKEANNYFIDRSKSGNIDFEKGFGIVATAPRFAQTDSMNLELVIDNASVELFADGGLSTMTAIFFPNQLYSNISIASASGFKIKNLEFNKLKSALKTQ